MPTDVSFYLSSSFPITLTQYLLVDVDYIAEENRQKGGGGFWTIEYYQPHFDVDTQTVGSAPFRWIQLI